jgi:hypothetical protein
LVRVGVREKEKVGHERTEVREECIFIGCIDSPQEVAAEEMQLSPRLIG